MFRPFVWWSDMTRRWYVAEGSRVLPNGRRVPVGATIGRVHGYGSLARAYAVALKSTGPLEVTG